MKQVSATVVSNDELWPGAYLLWAQAPEIAALARPGQYVMLRCGEGHDMPLRRPLSVHRTSLDGNVAFLFAVVGRGTEWLAQRKEGDPLDLFGPLGNGFDIYSSSRKLLLIAGGIGIAPLAALAEQAVAADLLVNLLIGAETRPLIYPDHLLPSVIKIATATEDGSRGHRGMVTDLPSLPNHIPDFIAGVDQVFACGPLPMYRRMAQMSGQLRDKPTQILLEVVLGCGVGACLGCTIETRHGQRLVCKDGPVFELSDITWDEAVGPPAGSPY